MVVQKTIQLLLNQLVEGNPVKISIDGSDLMIRYFNPESKILISTSIYQGDNYIPGSVRHCINHKAPFSQMNMLTYISVDEKEFRIKLNYAGHEDFLSKENLTLLLEEFGSLAEKWRLYLDEHDKRDLIYVRVK
ncbi:MAG: hypothetical protein Q8K60_00910 [Parachlamydiaceae bacterium]|nr:hypothetical protein [Parachlamydiaceae bacterium]